MKTNLYRISDLSDNINRAHFWSYDKGGTKLPGEILIEQVLKYGTIEEIFALFNLMDADYFMNTYKNKVRPIFEGKGVPSVFNSLSASEQAEYMKNNLDRSSGLVKLFDIILPAIYKIKKGVNYVAP